LGRSAAFLMRPKTAPQLILANDRLHAAVNRSPGAIYILSFDGQDFVGTLNYITLTPGGATGSGNSGIGLYFDY